MSTKENNEVDEVEKVTENDKASADAKRDIKEIKRPAEEKNKKTKNRKKEDNEDGDGEVEEEEKNA